MSLRLPVLSRHYTGKETPHNKKIYCRSSFDFILDSNFDCEWCYNYCREKVRTTIIKFCLIIYDR